MKTAVITGVGAVSPFGLGWNLWRDGLRHAVSATRTISLFDANHPVAGNDRVPALACRVAAEVPGFDAQAWLSPKDVDRVPRVVPLALAATQEALCSAGLGEISDEARREISVVLGSGGARSVPDGFDKAQGEKQFVQFCRELGPVCDEIGITIAIEPLNSREDNLVNSVAHGARIVDEVNHPRIRVLADLYHIAEDKEPLEGTTQAGARLAHTHLADRGRVAPGYSVDGEEDFLGFFQALRAANYDARCSFEGKFVDIGAQLGPTISLMKQRWRESA